MPKTVAPSGTRTGDFTLQLHANYPNPFSESTVIGFELPEAGKVNLKVFDTQGRQVKTLLSANMQSGVHQLKWKGDDNNGQLLPSGIYFLPP